MPQQYLYVELLCGSNEFDAAAETVADQKHSYNCMNCTLQGLILDLVFGLGQYRFLGRHGSQVNGVYRRIVLRNEGNGKEEKSLESMLGISFN